MSLLLSDHDEAEAAEAAYNEAAPYEAQPTPPVAGRSSGVLGGHYAGQGAAGALHTYDEAAESVSPLSQRSADTYTSTYGRAARAAGERPRPGAGGRKRPSGTCPQADAQFSLDHVQQGSHTPPGQASRKGASRSAPASRDAYGRAAGASSASLNQQSSSPSGQRRRPSPPREEYGTLGQQRDGGRRAQQPRGGGRGGSRDNLLGDAPPPRAPQGQAQVQWEETPGSQWQTDVGAPPPQHDERRRREEEWREAEWQQQQQQQHAGMDTASGLGPGMVPRADAARGEAFANYYDAHAGADTQSGLGPGMVPRADAARGEAFADFYGGQHAGKDTASQLSRASAAPPPQQRRPSAAARDASPQFARPARSCRSEYTSRSTSSQPAGKPTHRGEARVQVGIGRPRRDPRLREQLEGAEMSALLQDPTHTGPAPSPEVVHARARAAARQSAEFKEPTQDLQSFAAARARQQGLPYAGTLTRRPREESNPLIDPAAAARSPPMRSTAQAAYAPPTTARPPTTAPADGAGGRTKRTSFGEAFVRPNGATFVRAGQVAEASGAAHQAAHAYVGAHVSAPFGVHPEDTAAGQMSWRTTTGAHHGEAGWSDAPPTSMAGRIAKRRLQGKQRASSGSEHDTLTVHTVC